MTRGKAQKHTQSNVNGRSRPRPVGRMCMAFSACLALTGAAFVNTGKASDFLCTNRAAQISCDPSGCEVTTEGFTPMFVSVERDMIEVCAYAGCWSGPLDLIHTRGNLTMLHAKLGGGQGAVSVTYDNKTKVATMLWGSFAQPLNCGGEE